MAGFRTFATGEVLTAANVNDFLMKQSVMVFADATARTAALGAEVTEGMLTFNKDTGALEVFDGADFVEAGGGGGFDDVEVITATNATFSVPALASPIVKVTVIGGGGSGGGEGSDGATGGTSTFDAGTAGSVDAVGGTGGRRAQANTANNQFSGRRDGFAATVGLASGNGGSGGTFYDGNNRSAQQNGQGGLVTVAYLDLTGISTVNVIVAAGGAKVGATSGSAGGRGEVIVEYKAA